MDIAVSPYHITTREPPAVVSFLLASRAVTALPVPRDGEAWEDVADAASRTPGYRRLLESWRWTMPLWRAGVIGSLYEGEDPLAHARAVAADLADGQAYPGLGTVIRPAAFDGGELARIAMDMLRAGPDPAISLPVLAGLDRCAAACGLMVARSGATSLAQRAEARLAGRSGAQRWAIAIPVLAQAGGARLLEARSLLSDTLVPLRRALTEAEGVADAAAAYAAAFERARGDLLAPARTDDEDEDIRVVEGAARITATVMPIDIVLRSSEEAMSELGLASGGATMRERAGAPAAAAVLAPRDRFVALTIDLLGRRRDPTGPLR